MKIQSIHSRALGALAFSALSTIIYQPSTLLAQGSLTPPGAPAPTMKSLDVIEPRTPISSVPYTISSPGSYYVTTNLNVATGDGITIITNSVTLDLNGFTLSSTDQNNIGSGILLAGSDKDISILNGYIFGSGSFDSGVYSGSGFAFGINFSGAAPSNVRVARVSVSGCRAIGIYLPQILFTENPNVVEFCTVQNAGHSGIWASSVIHSTGYQCGGAAFVAETASDCFGQSMGQSDAFDVKTANNCVGYNDGASSGVTAITANNCYGKSKFGHGLYAGTANNCYGESRSSGDGVHAVTANNCQGRSDSGNGLYVNTACNCVGYSSSGDGVHALDIANNSSGSSGASGTGVYGFIVVNSLGRNSGNGYGVYAYDMAIGSYGQSTSGTGLRAYIANSSDANSFSAGIHKFNMP